jgi:hypothetical protein
MSEQSLNDILKDLKKSEEKISIYIPSLKQDVEFKSLSLFQQKSIIDKVTLNAFGIIDFFNSIFDVIKTNTTVNLNDINTIDRINIILSLRKNINTVYEDINIEALLEKNKTLSLPSLAKTIKTEKFEFEVSVPSLTTDFKFNNYIINTFKDEKLFLGKLLVNELCKFVNKIVINENNNIIDFNNQSNKNKFTIIEAIDSKQFKEVFQYISLVRDTELEFVKFEDKQIDIGPDMFIM